MSLRNAVVGVRTRCASVTAAASLKRGGCPSSATPTFMFQNVRNHATVSFSRSSNLSTYNTLIRRRFTTKKPEADRVAKEATASTDKTTFLQRFLGPKEMPPRWTFAWYREMVLLCTVFAITGSSTMVLVRPAVSKGLGLQGSLKDGPWAYRICSIVIMTPIYATMLVCVGTIFGRHHYFRHFSVKMWSRFGIPPEAMDKNFHETAKHFRKY